MSFCCDFLYLDNPDFMCASGTFGLPPGGQVTLGWCLPDVDATCWCLPISFPDSKSVPLHESGKDGSVFHMFCKTVTTNYHCPRRYLNLLIILSPIFNSDILRENFKERICNEHILVWSPSVSRILFNCSPYLLLHPPLPPHPHSSAPVL